MLQILLPAEVKTEAAMKKTPVLIKVFNNGYLISLLLFLAGSIASLCDGVIASRGLGVAELAAIGIVYPYTKTMECISLMFSSGSQVLIGRKIGQNRFDEVSKVFYTSLAFTAVLSVFIAAAVSGLADPVSRLFGANGETLQPTVEYLRSLAVGAPAHLLTLYMIALFQLDEKKKLVNLATIVMTVVNVGLNILFVIIGMGIKGIGYSTSISYYAALLILSVHFFDRRFALRGRRKAAAGATQAEAPENPRGILLQGKFGINRGYLLETIREGAPSAFKNVSSIIFNTVINNVIGMVGTTEAMAAFSVFKMTKFLFLSVSEAIISPVRMIQTMLIEEKDHKMLRGIFRYSLLKGLTLSALLSALLCIFARPVYSLMVQGAVLKETVTLMRWSAIAFFVNSFVCYYLAYFQAIGKKKTVYSISVVLNVATLPVFILLARAFGSEGIWISIAIQLVVTAAYTVVCAYVMGRRNKGLVNRLLVLPLEENYTTHDFHIESEEDAKAATAGFAEVCGERFTERRKSFYCSLALEEIVFNILAYQKHIGEENPNIDVHIVVFGHEQMTMRIKDCSAERDPFAKYEYSVTGDDLENLGIRIVKSFAQEIKYSYIYGVNFITITL